MERCILTVVQVPNGDITDEQIDALLLEALSSMTSRTNRVSNDNAETKVRKRERTGPRGPVRQSAF